jgi:hypothetical protein
MTSRLDHKPDVRSSGRESFSLAVSMLAFSIRTSRVSSRRRRSITAVRMRLVGPLEVERWARIWGELQAKAAETVLTLGKTPIEPGS